MEPQRWWVECKGRKGTVEAEEVRNAVNDTTALPDLAYLVIATNTTFSNPTRDWVARWQATRPRPVIKLWDRDGLERLLSRHPGVVLRLFSEALSPPGLLRAVRQRFWERLEYAPEKALRRFWSERGTIDIDPLARFALIANEFAHGDIGSRPWAAHASWDGLIDTLKFAFGNLAYLVTRDLGVGVDATPLVAALAHLIVAALQACDAEEVARLVLVTFLGGPGERLPEEAVDLILMPVIHRVAGDMQDICTADCERVSMSGPSTLVVRDPIGSYWRRLDPSGASAEEEGEEFRIERHDGPCKVGFEVGRERGCPLFDDELSAGGIGGFLAVVKRVSAFRLAEAGARAAEDAGLRSSRPAHEA